MKSATIKKINEINRKFYQQVGPEFDRTRSNPWKGWDKIWEQIKDLSNGRSSILDLGCGNGRFAVFLKDKGFIGSYQGLDFDEYLLKQAEQQNLGLNFEFMSADILEKWPNDNKFDIVAAFGLFHHIPSRDQRMKILQISSDQLTPGGYIVASFWQFNREKAFPVPLGIDSNDLEPNDYFLSWNNNPEVLRYCHYFSKDEVTKLFQATDLEVIETFTADAGNLYVIAQKHS